MLRSPDRERAADSYFETMKQRHRRAIADGGRESARLRSRKQNHIRDVKVRGEVVDAIAGNRRLGAARPKRRAKRRSRKPRPFRPNRPTPQQQQTNQAQHQATHAARTLAFGSTIRQAPRAVVFVSRWRKGPRRAQTVLAARLLPHDATLPVGCGTARGAALSSIARRFARAEPPQPSAAKPPSKAMATPPQWAQRSHGPPSAAKAKAAMSSEAVTVFWAPFPSTGKGLGIGAAPSPRGDGGEAYSAQGKRVPKGENRPRFSSFAASPCARAAQRLAARKVTCKSLAQRVVQAAEA